MIKLEERKAIPNSVCEHCDKRDTLVIDVTEVADKPDVDHHEIVCTDCNARTHSHFLDRKLKMLEEQIERETHPVRKNKLRRRFSRKFEKLQAEMADA